MKKNFCLITSLLLLSGISILSCTGKKQSEELKSGSDSTVIVADTLSATALSTCRDTITEAPYDIPAQCFDETAQALCHATGCVVKTDLSKTGRIEVNPVKGRMSILDAIRTAIEGTKLKITGVTDDSITIELTEENDRL